MPRHTSAWKDAERRVAQITEGERISGPRGVKMEDVSHPVFSIEVKHGKTCIPKFVSDALEQAKRNAPSGKTPLVVLHPHGSREYLAVLPLRELIRLLKLADEQELLAEAALDLSDAMNIVGT